MAYIYLALPLQDSCMAIGDKLKESRLSVGLTQQALARLLRSGQSSIARWENGQGLPEGEYLAAYVEHLQSPADWHFDDARTETVGEAREVARLVADLGPAEIRRRCLGISQVPQVGRVVSSAEFGMPSGSNSEPKGQEPPPPPKRGRPPRQ